tara:strand:+ start:1165 stop:2142 length:978 start_codon:yes stop_codon:yes gene_type:complete
MKIGIIGSGLFGSSLAYNFSYNSKKINLWNRTKINKKIIIKKLNSLNCGKSLSQLSSNLKIRKSISKMVEKSDIILLCIKTQSLFSFFEKNYTYLKEKPLIFCSKGIDSKKCLFPTEIGEKFLNKDYFAVLSGPGFASDIIKQKPIALSLACKNVKLGKKIQNIISSPIFRLYLNRDLVGTQLGGALKNVIAIACGITDSRELGESAKSALITRGFFEIRQIGKSLGCEIETLYGLSGLGDLSLTCNSKLSRNYNFGLKIAENKKNKKETIEGKKTANAAFLISKKYKLDLPIIETVNNLINESTDIEIAIEKILKRPLKNETSI